MKDELYYADLIYLVKGLANLIPLDNIETNMRIIKREQPLSITENGKTTLKISPFSLELVEIINEISRIAPVEIKNFDDIKQCPDVVNSVLTKFQNNYSLSRH